jgi:hypothetical protein
MQIFHPKKILLISLPKCIEINSELILVLGLGPHQGPRSNIHFIYIVTILRIVR